MHPDERWYAALDVVGATRGDRDAAFAALAEAYRSPGRCYHTLSHAESVVDAALAIHADGDAWATVVLAAWFHDAVYDALGPRGANEGASAVLARRALQDLGATLAATGEVCRLICLTVDHDPAPADRAGALLADADLSTLAADQDVYDAYAAGIRAEYAHVADDDYRDGRRAVLRSFLDRPTIFRTLAGRERWESRARINISHELSTLA